MYQYSFYEKKGKRVIDIILSFMAIIILAPVYIGISVAIVIDDPGTVFFVQKRVGVNKQIFYLHKFRSMKANTPHNTPTHQLKNPEQYITRVGKIIRKYSLDELPQIWDILIGNMSFVGPRPALWNQEDLILERDKYHVNSVVPGLTGWAQVNGRDELAIVDKARLDGEYVFALRKGNFYGIFMDMKCIFKTIGSVVKAEGVVEGIAGQTDTRHMDL